MKIKKLPFFLMMITALILLIAATSLCVSAEEIAYPVEGGNIYFDTHWKQICNSDESITAAVIPSHINGIEVNQIKANAFKDRVDLKSVVIPETVNSLQAYAFYGCSSLESIVLPDNIEVIKRYAFYKCTALESIVLPANLTQIHKYAFAHCSSLKAIDIPDNVTVIENEAFSDCTSLSSVDLSDNLTDIGNHAFQRCIALESITIPKTIENYGSFVFTHCTALVSVNFCEGVTSVGRAFFSNCSSLKSVIIPDSVARIEDYAFADCSSLESITIPDSVYYIGDYAFLNCDSLKYVHYYGNDASWKEISIGDTCNDCLKYAVRHSMAWRTMAYPSCFNKGIEVAECEDCGIVATRDIAAKHTWADTVTVTASTCEQNGSGLRSCTECDATESVTLPASGHKWGEWITASEPGCATPGSRRRICSSCGTNELQDIAPTADHIWGEWKETTAPTCKKSGASSRSCINCTAAEVQTIPATGEHVFGDWVNVTPPLCEEDGVESQSCVSCDEEFTRTIPAIGHTWSEWTVLVPATGTAEGKEVHVCYTCGIIENRIISKLDMTNPFTDVKDGKWYTEGILYCYHNDYMTGMTSDLFGYKESVTRAMFVTILAKIDGADTSSYTETSFSDVKAGQWYSASIEWAYQNGYAAGIGDKIFGYKENVSREQLAMFLYTYSQKNGVDVSRREDISGFADVDRIHGYALDAVKWAVHTNLISGTSDTTLSPRDPATRAEISLIVMNYVENVKG